MVSNPFEDVETFLFDGDGVLYKEEEVLPGAVELVKILNQRKKQIFLLTNNSTKTRDEYAEKLAKLDIKIPTDNIFTSAYLTAKVMRNKAPSAKIYVIGEGGLKRELIAEGLEVVNIDQEENLENPFDMSFNDVDYVITGMDRNLTYVKLARAMNILKNPHKVVPFIASNGDITFPTPKGFLPGGGAMICLLEKLTQRKVDEIIGKPQPLMFEMALEKAKTSKEKAIMIGDRLETDILGAKKLGIKSCLVLTGAAKLEEIDEIKTPHQPDILVNNLQDIVESLKKNKK